MILRPPNADELQSLSDMCLRSKSVWNYDDAMLDAFRSELTLTEEDLEKDAIVVAEDRRGVAGLAALIHPELAEWVKSSVAFPNGMVDRITPATSQREIDHCRETLGIDDAWPVYCEEFKQWVLEDEHPRFFSSADRFFPCQ